MAPRHRPHFWRVIAILEPETRFPANRILITYLFPSFCHSQSGESEEIERETGKESNNLFLLSFSSCPLRWIDFNLLQLRQFMVMRNLIG
ncbi:hypothetical protein L1987_29517 [Smallanthus sonchifolius]|uniref:Uncharacterized protein n=1 Tax=Smallanthus sonchifolius TaxID=185202 RepID=A0ACB9I040_9ASTR|nr:hypothetical protein L1987_29517 [Smallanthus sonchifolius]